MSTQKTYPSEYIDFIMMTKLYHCTPSEFYAQDAKTIALHRDFYNLEIESDNLKENRRQQAASQKK